MSDADLVQRHFLARLDRLLTPEGMEPTDPAVWERVPHASLVGSLRGMVCRFDFLGDDEMWIVLQVRPSAHLLLRREGQVSRFLDKVGLSREVKVGDPVFDARYLVQHITKADARALFDGKIRDLVRTMEPFIQLEMAEKELRLLKLVDWEAYTPEEALQDLERLWTFHTMTMRVDLPDAGR